MPQNWTKLYVGSDEAACFFFVWKRGCSCHPFDRALQLNQVVHDLQFLVLSDHGPVMQPESAPPHFHHSGSVWGQGTFHQWHQAAVYCGDHPDCGKDREGRTCLFPLLGSHKMDGNGCGQLHWYFGSHKLRSFYSPGRLSLCKLKLAETFVWQWAWWNHRPLLPSDILIIEEFLMEKCCTNSVPSLAPPFSASSETDEVIGHNFRHLALNKYLIQSKIMAKGSHPESCNSLFPFKHP